MLKILHNEQPGERGEAQSAFDTAVSFHEAALRAATPVVSDDGSVVSPTPPSIACYAFACELYFKALHAALLGNAARGHRLLELFEGLPSAVQGSLRTRFAADLGSYGADLDGELAGLSEAFVEWRYVYESRGQILNQAALAVLAKALFETIRERLPWEVSSYLNRRLRTLPSRLAIGIENVGGGVMVQAVLELQNTHPFAALGWRWIVGD
jgi:hypothetical protein